MTRVKKSRKVGKIGIAKTDAPRKVKKVQLSKSTNTSGNKAGSRQQEALNNTLSNDGKNNQDPRIGSKKAIDLRKYQIDVAKPEEKTTRFQTPQHELDAIEADQKLEQLLEKQASKKLSLAEQDYVTKTLKRHKQLCEMLGIAMVDEESEQETDPFAQLDAIRLDDFKD